MVAIWALLIGCGGSEAEIYAQAEQLCRWGQTRTLTPSLLPDSVDLGEIVREADLRWALDQQAQRDGRHASLAGSPFGAFAQPFVTAAAGLDDATRALVAAQARHASCEIEVTVDGETARAVVVRTVPLPFPEPEAMARMGALARLPTHEARVAEASRWLNAASATRTDVAHLTFARESARWRADLGLPEAAAQGR